MWRGYRLEMSDKIKITNKCQYSLLNPTKSIDISNKPAIINHLKGKPTDTEFEITPEFATLLRNSMTYPYSSGTVRTLVNGNEKICIEVVTLSKGYGGGRRRTKRSKRSKRSKRTRRAKRRA